MEILRVEDLKKTYGKDHTTVMHSVNKITNEIKKDKVLNDEIQKIVNQIK